MAGAFAGLAIFGNIKALVVLVPVVLVALRSSAALRRASLRAWGAGLVGLALLSSPLFIAAVFDPARGFAAESVAEGGMPWLEEAPLTWQQIADALGVSRQAAHARYANRKPTT